MEKWNAEIEKIMEERFGHDSLIALATVDSDMPAVRTVNSYYENGAFYVVTYTLSNKMRQLQENPKAAICGDWFTAHGVGENLGWVLEVNNAEMMSKLRKVFASWYDNGHTNESDPNTCLLRIRLTDGVLFNNGKRYDIDFSEENTQEVRFYDQADDNLLNFAVIVARSRGKWVFCKHRERDTYEFPGGHREPGEAIDETARRELQEETGALDFTMRPVCVYSVTGKTRVNCTGEESFGMLYEAEITAFAAELHSEMEKVILTDQLPEKWTYPQIQPRLMREVLIRKGEERR